MTPMASPAHSIDTTAPTAATRLGRTTDIAVNVGLTAKVSRRAVASRWTCPGIVALQPRELWRRGRVVTRSALSQPQTFLRDFRHPALIPIRQFPQKLRLPAR